MDDNLRYWLGFNLVLGIGPVRLRALIRKFGDVQSAWLASESDLRSLNLDRRALSNLLEVRLTANFDVLLARLERDGVHVLTWDSPDYPALLSHIPDPPPVLFVSGEITPADEWAVAAVGTRKVSAYGREVARRLGEEFARNATVSGMDAYREWRAASMASSIERCSTPADARSPYWDRASTTSIHRNIAAWLKPLPRTAQSLAITRWARSPKARISRPVTALSAVSVWVQ